MVEVATQISENLQQCVETRCTDRRSKQACLGVMDCEWCVLENDGKSLLKKPFCSTQRVCFAGVLGATTPYHDEIMGKVLSTQFICSVNFYTVLFISPEIDKPYCAQHTGLICLFVCVLISLILSAPPRSPLNGTE